jgi:hypothetical protein
MFLGSGEVPEPTPESILRAGRRSAHMQVPAYRLFLCFSHTLPWPLFERRSHPPPLGGASRPTSVTLRTFEEQEPVHRPPPQSLGVREADREPRRLGGGAARWTAERGGPGWAWARACQGGADQINRRVHAGAMNVEAGKPRPNLVNGLACHPFLIMM